MPTYNSSKTIRTAIESILNQDYKNFNVYFCDDCSTDNTIEIIQEYMKKDDRIKYIAKNNQNSSAVFSRNKLIDLADGDYSIWVDSDDEVNTNICSFATWLLNQEKFDIITFPFELVNHSQNHNNYGKLYEYHHKYYGKDCYDFFMFKMKNYYNLWSKVIDTNLLKKSRVQDVSVYLVDDHLFAYPLYYNCQSFLSVNSEKMYIYNFGQGNWG
jgi:glycosyltransferase involved in cell wall biosynthesis